MYLMLHCRQSRRNWVKEKRVTAHARFAVAAPRTTAAAHFHRCSFWNSPSLPSVQCAFAPPPGSPSFHTAHPNFYCPVGIECAPNTTTQATIWANYSEVELLPDQTEYKSPIFSLDIQCKNCVDRVPICVNCIAVSFKGIYIPINQLSNAFITKNVKKKYCTVGSVSVFVSKV